MANDKNQELAQEQAHVDKIFESLDESREAAKKLKGMVEVGVGGTNQARWEREVFYENILNRLKDLDLGDRSICFGRIDYDEDEGPASYHIGRMGVSDSEHNVLLVDWRAPISEPFYRATGRDSLGLLRRRHFVSRGRQILDLEDEFFGDAAGKSAVVVGGTELQGHGALVAALSENRSGKLGDIVGTIQAEQDEIIRSPMKGILLCQGGPGTGKTVIALHRAAYLMYEHRFPLDTQGVLVIGPNKLFLGYIEQVLPSLGEAGVELSVLADLVGGVRVQGRDETAAARIKGDVRMIGVLKKAVKDRQRELTEDFVIELGVRKLRVTPTASKDLISEARRRYRDHNAAQSFVEAGIYEYLSEIHPDSFHSDTIRDQLAASKQMKELLERMWPLLTPAELLHDLFGSDALLCSAAGKKLNDVERKSLRREREELSLAEKVIWTVDDVPLLDEAWELLGPHPKKKGRDAIRTYGHIVVDEAQDLSPLQLRMLTRRSLSGSMTIVGDIAQSTGVWAHDSWQDILDHLPEKQITTKELTVGYRIPGPIMKFAGRILEYAIPGMSAPESVRSEGDEPEVISVASQDLLGQVVETAVRERDYDGSPNVAVVCPASMYEEIIGEFESRDVEVGKGLSDDLKSAITIIPVHVVKGLEVDSSVVVEPAKIVSEESQGERSLYVGCTRSTKRLTVVHSESLPRYLAS